MAIEDWMRFGILVLALVAGILFLLRPRRGREKRSAMAPGAAVTSHVPNWTGYDADAGGHSHSSAGHGDVGGGSVDS